MSGVRVGVFTLDWYSPDDSVVLSPAQRGRLLRELGRVLRGDELDRVAVNTDDDNVVSIVIAPRVSDDDGALADKVKGLVQKFVADSPPKKA